MFSKFIKGTALAFAVAILAPASAMADSIDPASYADTLAVGESVTIRKTVTVTEAAPTGGILDVMFLIDTSGSMGTQIAAAKAAASAILTGLAGFGDVASGVGYYSEPGSDGVYRDLTTNTATGVADIGSITLGLGGYGGDFPEEGINATYEAATSASWRTGSTRIIIALGDATFKESDGVTEAMALTALDDAGATFIGIDFSDMTTMGLYGGSTTGDLETNPQTLADATGGSIIASSGLSTAALVADIMSGVSDSFDEYTTVTVDDLGAGIPGVGVSVECVSAAGGACVGSTAMGTYDRSAERTFEFDVTFEGLTAGVHDFATLALVDGGATAKELDTITVRGSTAVPAPGTLALLGLGLVAMGSIRRRRAV
jgi:hypothetical protein